MVSDTHAGSAFVDLIRLQELQRLEVLCVESRVADVIKMLRSITTATFQRFSIYIPLTSFELSFACLDFLDNIVHRRKLPSGCQIHIFLLCKNIPQQEAMRDLYGQIVHARLSHVLESGILTIHWSCDDNFESKFQARPGKDSVWLIVIIEVK